MGSGGASEGAMPGPMALLPGMLPPLPAPSLPWALSDSVFADCEWEGREIIRLGQVAEREAVPLCDGEQTSTQDQSLISMALQGDLAASRALSHEA